MAHFKKTNAKIFAKTSQKVTLDTEYWRKLGAPVVLKEFGPIDYIDFSPVEPYWFAVTCSVRVQVYNPFTKTVHKTLSKFKENALGAKIRSDGQLLCAGGEESLVKLFDIHSKSLLRVFRDHTGPVHRCFFTSDNTHIVSFSDDKSSKLWDIPSEQVVQTFSSHQDYVRAGAVSPVSPHVFLSGSYDNKISLFDSRTSNDPVFTVDHGAPVESLLFLPSGGIFFSAGGNEVRVWDGLGGGRLIARLTHHHKTVTCLALASSGTRLVSGSLDRHLKISDISSYSVVHNIDYPNSILSVGLSANDETLAVGTVDGFVHLSKRETPKEDDSLTKKKERNSYRYVGDKYIAAQNVDSTVALDQKSVQAKHDTFLRKFQYARALECVLSPYVTNKNPQVTVSVMHELIRRKGLSNALIFKNKSKTLVNLLRFLVRYIGDYRFSSLLIDVSHILIDVMEKNITECNPLELQLFKRLLKKVQEELDLTKVLKALSGSLEMLAAGAGVARTALVPLPITPSDCAKQNLQLTV